MTLFKSVTQSEGPAPGEKLGKYEIADKIGGGSFGGVYRGWDPALQRAVAIKTCEIPQRDLRARFFREAKLAARLHHPNIVTIYDFDGENDVPYIVQELLSGEDLSQKIARGDPISLDEAVRILGQIASGLAHAHAEGVVHRDIKPANVHVTSEGTAKILDFGIAKALDAESTMTRPDTTLGSATYMSPEQIDGRRVDHRTDIFSLGVVGYELFTGRPPFNGRTLAELFQRIMHEEPQPLSELRPSVPSNLEALIVWSMSKQPADRPSDAAEFRRALEATNV